MARHTDPAAGLAALAAWRAGEETQLATAVRFTLDQLALAAPGRSVEVRVPPFGAVQCVEGTTHRRGTPPAAIETDAATWLRLVTGGLSWADAVASGRVTASGERTDLSWLLPLAQFTEPHDGNSRD